MYREMLATCLSIQDGDEQDRARMASQLGSSIVSEKPNVHWDDVSGLEHAKDALKEAVILPVKFPQVLPDLRATTCSCCVRTLLPRHRCLSNS
jgi:SpoVK/Ycf46/Vps4 family AAA+-type ATPase